MTERKHRNGRDRNRSQFHESLSAAIPNRTYRSQIESPDRTTAPQTAVQWIATVLVILLLLRFAIELFTTSRANIVAAAVFGLTDWAVAPFHALWGGVPAQSNTMGTFDWSTIAALTSTIILGWILIALLRPRSR